MIISLVAHWVRISCKLEKRFRWHQLLSLGGAVCLIEIPSIAIQMSSCVVIRGFDNGLTRIKHGDVQVNEF